MPAAVLKLKIIPQIVGDWDLVLLQFPIRNSAVMKSMVLPNIQDG